MARDGAFAVFFASNKLKTTERRVRPSMSSA